MPPARRGRPPGSTSSNSTSNNPRGAQSTLAFGRSNKITKPSIPAPASKKAVKPHAQQQEQQGQQGKEITHLAVEEERSAHEEEEKEEEEEVVNGRREAAATRQGGGEDEDEEAEGKARKVSEAAVKRYWRAKEGERKAPRVHQQHLSLHEKILRHFDLSSQYGPCVGIPRVRRWKRAQGLGLQPPIEVLAVLVKEREEGEGGVGKERAFMDGLLGGSSVVG
ncbi:MAG: hypothetical protein LQ348_005704 [Seirophora lacunosa]|nr:MAG: hypothetical protein LQ348_005704 [Seirophora lacunosa]